MKLATRLKSLNGARLGFLENRKKHSDVFVRELRKSICEEASPAKIRTWTKTSVYGALAKRAMGEILSGCDALVVGPSDCGHGSSCSLHDIFELESRGIPVAWIDTPGRVPKIARVRGAYVIEYATNFMIERAVEQYGVRPGSLARAFEKFGFHRALRVAGAKPGDRVRVGKVDFELWPYPPPKLEGSTDGVLGYPYIVLEKFRRASATELRTSARRLSPEVIQALLR
jgi:hypothetical protein